VVGNVRFGGGLVFLGDCPAPKAIAGEEMRTINWLLAITQRWRKIAGRDSDYVMGQGTVP
jgi:hypothetical protein